MSGSKKLVNQTGVAINGVLDVRKGSNPQDHLKNVPFSIPANGTTNVQYGDDQNPFLNGVSYEYKPSGSLVSFSAQVATRGSQWDDVFNTNSTLTFHDISPSASISGSN
ncbi:MAG TPA: hypothetical protein VKU40_10385 [Thermoanaerobaculia bacterium]|nr:hypothetical protein [Thermoanaerobaculia bacterium]